MQLVLLADGARGYCFCYRFKGIMRAIKEKLSTIKGKYICVYGYVNYGNRSSKDASDPWKDYVNSVFSKGVFYMMMEGFDLLILGKGRYRRPGFKPKQLVNNGIYMRTGFVQCESKAVGKEVKTQ